MRDDKVADWYDRAVRAAAAAPDAGERARALRELCTGPAPAPPPRRRRFHRSRRRPAATLFPTAQVRDLLDLDARALSAVLDASPRCGLSTAYANPPPAVVEALGRTAATVVVPSPTRTASPARRAPRLSCRSRTRASPGTSRRSSRGRATCARGPRRARPTTPRAAGRFRRATSGASARRSSGPRTGTCGRIGATSSSAQRWSCATARCGAASATSGAGCGRAAIAIAGLDGRCCVSFCGRLV